MLVMSDIKELFVSAINQVAESSAATGVRICKLLDAGGSIETLRQQARDTRNETAILATDAAIKAWQQELERDL